MVYQKFLAELISYQETGKGKHEWLVNTKAEGIRLANYLRGHGYTVEYNYYPNSERLGCGHLVTVPNKSLQ